MKSAGNRGVVQSRLQVLHGHVFLAAPLGARHVTKPGADQHQGGVAVRERPHHPRPAADLTVQPLDHVVGTDARPMFAGKIAVGQRLLNAVLDLLGSLLQLHGAQLGDHSLCLLAGRLLTLLGVDRLEHFCHNFDLGFGHNRENVAVEMHRAALVFGVREHLAHSLQHPHALVADDELHAIQAASAQPLEEADPAGLVLLHALGGAQNLTKTVLIHGDRHQNSYIFVLSAPVAAQVDAVHVDVWIAPALQGAVAPVLDVNVGFLVQFADGGGRDLAAPQRLRDVLYRCNELTEKVIGVIADIGIDVAKEHFKNKLLEVKAKEKLSEYLTRQKKYNFDCSLEEEIDFEGLAEYIHNDLMDDVKIRLFGKKRERGVARETIADKAAAYAQAKTKLSRNRAKHLAVTIKVSFVSGNADPNIHYSDMFYSEETAKSFLKETAS